ncbi:MAG: sugar ABC transporter permease [Oscillospiraceae bacterium]|jgi:sn-glycerol 3-phosphate transport system permease protein|nr:sugar ABC transporter permease [Oscillospiraceae bacterium]
MIPANNAVSKPVIGKTRARTGSLEGHLHRLTPYLFLAPSLLVFAMFYYFPFIKTIVMSGYITNNRGILKKFVGFANYLNLFRSPDFKQSLLVTLRFMPMVFIPTLILGMLMALIAEKRVKYLSPVTEVLFSLPMAVASASAAIVWRMAFHPSVGVLNYVLGTQFQWLTDKNTALFSVALVTVWLQVGFTFIFLVTGLRCVPAELIESASLDGCGALRQIVHIKLPMISPTLFFVIFFNLIASFQSFGQVRLLTQGGPGTTTLTLGYIIYLEAFQNKRYGSAAAMSMLLFLLLLSITLMQFRFERKGVFYN